MPLSKTKIIDDLQQKKYFRFFAEYLLTFCITLVEQRNSSVYFVFDIAHTLKLAL